MIFPVDLEMCAGWVNPSLFIMYLEKKGWKKFPIKRTDIQIYQMQKDREHYQVTIPVNRELSDYSKAMLQAITGVSLYENKTITEILIYLLSPRMKLAISRNKPKSAKRYALQLPEYDCWDKLLL